MYNIIRAIPLVLKDMREKTPYPYGVYGYVGLYGSGKSQKMSYDLIHYSKKYPNCKIATNYGYLYEDYQISSVDDIIELYDQDGIIFALDEIQNDFFTRDFQSFPRDLIHTLTQVRKMRKMILYTTPQSSYADSMIRTMTHKLFVMSNPFRNGRYFRYKTYYADEYKPDLSPDERQTRSIGGGSFVATDSVRGSYDTFSIISQLQKERGQGHLKPSPSLVR